MGSTLSLAIVLLFKHIRWSRQYDSGPLHQCVKVLVGHTDPHMHPRKMELLRRRKKKAEQLRAEAGVSQQDLAAMAEKAEQQQEDGAPKKLKVALSFKLGAGAASGGAGPSRFAPGEPARAAKPTTSRF